MLSQDILEYKKKQRPQKIRMLDGAVKTVMVDDSKTVGELLVTICSRIGITNYEEYSLIQEFAEEKKEESTGTLKKDRTLLRDERKMEKLKAKLHTDDDLNWLDHSRTFREQGVDENETLLLRRKFFYSDQNVDSRDPVQLNLLYVQARDDILNGSHPVSFDKACEFGGIQAQIQFGPHVEYKHKPGFLDLKEFLPKEYIKQRGAEKKIFQDHKNCGEMTEIEAKVKYVKLARSLRTYGVSFFLVKEKMKSKNKLVPRLLGITKDSVMRVEERTKDVVQEWPLTTVKRWAASPKSFTLDFGEYQESYYSVQTTEGEQISQLIAGYIDIILKKKQSKDRFGLEGDEESTMLEESVSPKKSTILQQQFNRVGRVEHGCVALPAVMRSGSGGPETFNMGSMPSAQQHVMTGQMHRGHMPPLSSAQQALMGTINTSMQAVQQAQTDLGEVGDLPPLGQDMQQFNRVGRVEHGCVALPAVMRSGSGGPETFNMGSMPSAQQHVMTGQMHRGHMPPLSSAQQALMGTINTSMQAVQQAQTDLGEVGDLPPLGQDMASRVWVQNKVDESKHEIHSQVDAITAGTASVVNLTAGDPADTDYTAVGCAITTISSNLTEMSKGVKLLAAFMDDDVGSGQDLMKAARTLAGAVSDLLKAVEPASGEPRQTVLTAAGSIGQASGDLLRHIGESEADERFQDVLMNLAKAVANAAAMMVLKAKNVAQVAEDTVLQNRVIAAATQCALSTSQLVACAKVVSPTISSPVCQEQLIEAGKLVDRSVEGCVKACLSATDDNELLKQVNAAAIVVSQALNDLLQHVRHYASRGEPIGRYDQATDTIMTVTESIFSSMGDAGEMVRQARVLAQATSDLVNAMRSDAEAEIDVDNSKKLLAAAKLLADATARMVEAAKDILEYKKKQRPQKIRMLDGAVKTVMVDDSKTVGELLVTICSRIGITNYEEYSLIQEFAEEKKEESTGTLKKDRTLLRDERKMEKLKAKLHTDDDLNWLDHSRTFREQGVDENETLLLRRKFFYSDQNVDSRDPVQLNLLYVQARDDILNGSHPVSFDKACEFGGIQAQIQFGPHVEHKHKPGFLDLKEFLPKEYIKQRGAEKKIFQDHKNCGEMTEIEAKVKYVKLARSLRTYGVSFFLVKEKMKSKNKLVPRLLGITKDSVMRVEERTKDVVQEWPLTTVKRWAASPKSFTLDFGEYQESYYSVQTTEGEQISQLIAGYIDIILKKKQSKDRFGLEGDEESTMLEESVSPKKSTILQQQFNRVGRVEHGCVALPAVMRSGSGGPETFNMGSMPSAQQHVMTGQMHRGHMPPLSSAQQALMGTINTSMQAVQQAQTDLGEVGDLPPLGQDMASRVWVQNKVDESKHEIHSQVDAITAGTASVVNLTAGDPADTDYTAVGCAITTISSNLTEMSKGVKLLAAFMDDDVGSGQDLMKAARTLAGAVSDLLKAVEPASGEPRQTVLTAAGSIGQASGDLLRHIGESEADERFQDVLMNLAKAVANAAAMMVLKAKNVAQVAEDTVLQNRVIAAATQCALSTSQLVACAKVVSPTISSPVCQEQLIEAGKLVDRSVEGCVKACLSATDDNELLKQVNAAAIVVSQALNDLLQHVRHYASRGEPIGRYDQATDTIMTVTESIFSSMGDAGEMVRQARVLAQATSDLVNAMRSDAEAEIDVDNSKKLLAAAKLLADATARMVEAAKVAKAVSHSLNNCVNCLPGQKDVDMALKSIGEASKKLLVDSLPPSSKSFQEAQSELNQAAADLNQSAGEVVHSSRGTSSQLAVASGKFSEDFDEFLDAGIEMAGQTQSKEDQIQVIGNLKNISMSSSKLLLAAKSLSVDPGAPNTKNLLAAAARAVTESINQLITLCTQQAPGQKECDNALRELETVKGMLDNPNEPVSDLSYFDCIESVMENSKVLGESMAGISHNCKTGDLPAFGDCVSVASKALCGLTEAAGQVLSAATIVAKHTSALCNACRIASSKTGNPVAKRHFVQSAKEVANSTANLVKTIKMEVSFEYCSVIFCNEWVDPEDPTVIAETELLGAAASIEAAAKKLEQLKPRAKPKQADENLDFEEQILEAAKSIAAATSALVKSASAAQRELVAQGKVGSIPANAVDDGQWSQGLISAARMVAAATSNLCEAANASVQGHASEEKLISSAKQVAASTAQLLVACKVKADQDSEAMRRLQAAGNAVKRASDNLVRAAQKAAFDKNDAADVVVKTKFVGGIAQIIAAQEEMLRKERELEEARKKLAQIRQQQYKFLPTELREDEN
ncbi:Talin-2 [Acipenser ruthenus]|uniref:Talin-2 n=1 Tax=Acipenser ruthenus TaxID=7906 RepID=A0A444UEW7_ACIRT|nr:Talin-2 [Acipenser ruthenus]